MIATASSEAVSVSIRKTRGIRTGYHQKRMKMLLKRTLTPPAAPFVTGLRARCIHSANRCFSSHCRPCKSRIRKASLGPAFDYVGRLRARRTPFGRRLRAPSSPIVSRRAHFTICSKWPAGSQHGDRLGRSLKVNRGRPPALRRQLKASRIREHFTGCRACPAVGASARRRLLFMILIPTGFRRGNKTLGLVNRRGLYRSPLR
jgi:hypothetical protein